MATHELKCWQYYFRQVASGDKKFEIRKNDRNFQVGDILNLREYLPAEKEFTGLGCPVKVTSLLSGGAFSALEPDVIKPGYVIMSIERFGCVRTP